MPGSAAAELVAAAFAGDSEVSQHAFAGCLYTVGEGVGAGAGHYFDTRSGAGVEPVLRWGRQVDRFRLSSGRWLIEERRLEPASSAAPASVGTKPGRPAPEPTADELAWLADRCALRRLLVDYTHGGDRWDADLLTSTFHPDAVLAYNTYSGPAVDFFRRLFTVTAAHEPPDGQHVLLNVNLDFAGDRAYGESYFWARRAGVGDRRQVSYLGTAPGGGPGYPLERIGRWIDRFERRDGRWAISHRRILVEWLPEELENTYLGDYKLSGLGPALRDRNDPSYERV
jgi:hypothetical protein